MTSFDFWKSKKDRTFRPKKKFEEGTTQFHLHKQAKASLHAGLDLKRCVRLPPNEEVNDWVAVHVVDFFNRINLIYGVISEQCTDVKCPKMSGGGKFEYFWADENNKKKPVALPAPQYVANLMEWIESKIKDQTVFPTNTSVPFPKNFLSICKKIFTRLYRVFVHTYIHHFQSLVSIGAEAHVNQCYKHFVYFVSEFHMLAVNEVEPLRDLTEKLCPGCIKALSTK